ncbi:radical SAM protein [Mesorhizobium sp. BR1-1-9]|uniref:radical SAM protein n=1 Tax=Mesorhizobium sp. BR1-1-13 TaxID=2876656 RepID=UPI001CD0B988|nr:radical SAM protein [Mesorhizobium sp. BR1-1-13]MBZ9870357.1 radical SAM protein [Mesorhizobium sp. BR1-1-9]MBZ9942317.1 radical SAM protein [Mesorhizobium sp. BR1-1-13]
MRGATLAEEDLSLQPFLKSPLSITLSITQTCNLECKHCYADCQACEASAEVATDQWLGFLDYLVNNNFISVYFEGGEPLFREDFLQILAHCARRMMTMLRSNGTLINREMAHRLKQIGIGRVLIDLMGARAETHDYFTGVSGSFQKACEAVRYLLKAGIDTDVLTILNRRNMHELQEYLELAHELGVPRAGILRLYPLGRAKSRWDELAMSLQEQMAVLNSLAPPPELTVMKSWHPNDRNCCWQAAAVDPFGRSIGCAYLREYVDYGNIREVPFLDTWQHSLYRELRSGVVEKSCPDCDTTEGTRGGCRSAAYAFHGRWAAPDPFCSTMNDGVDLRVLPSRLLSKGRKPADSPRR